MGEHAPRQEAAKQPDQGRSSHPISEAEAPPISASPTTDILFLQRTIGNQAVQRLIRESSRQRVQRDPPSTSAAAPVFNALEIQLDPLLQVSGQADAAAIQGAIRRASDADRVGVARNQQLMGRLSSVLTRDQHQMVTRMLTSGLMGETSFTNTAEGTPFTSLMTMMRDGLTITKEVHFVSVGTFGANGFTALRDRMIAAANTFMSGKFKVKIQSAGARQEGDGEYPIRVRLVSNNSSPHPVNLRGGQHGRGAVSDSGGDIYELGQSNEAIVPDVYLAHEAAHLLLGATDEYRDASVPARVVQTDNSLMGNFYAEGVGRAEIKARHFQFLVNLVATWFPGRAVSIVS